MDHKVFNRVFLSIFFIFMTVYLSARSGLIDYQSKVKKELTEKQIAKFEEDIKNGVDVDINSYIESDRKYDNFLSRTTLKVSDTIGSTTKDILNFFFKEIEKSIKE